MSITSIELGWIAGILEGEGCFRIQDRCPDIYLGMTDQDTVLKMRNLMDKAQAVNIRYESHERNKPQYILHISSKRAVEWMMTLYPLMSIRRKAKIREVLATWRINHYDTQAEKQKKSVVIRELKRRGFSEQDARKQLELVLSQIKAINA